MDSDQSLADIGEATDSLDEYDLDESSSVDDGSLAPERYLAEDGKTLKKVERKNLHSEHWICRILWSARSPSPSGSVRVRESRWRGWSCSWE